ncbi:hypothetical protein Glove_553g24 [Diversispora epigaea]|uniref:Uncharacterized protein n=1 Tax=Diversispora epigaea TaxID=1348612 RepID=A0A397GDS7_9GLOM|nr:hypothetical protein Glove_553g24 [Diversispora epigaea]
MRCWDAHRPTFDELFIELFKYYIDYRDYLEGKNKDSEIVIQIEKAEEFLANKESTNTTTTTPLNYQTHPQAIFTSRFFNYSNLPKPKNEDNFEREIEGLTKSIFTFKEANILLDCFHLTKRKAVKSPEGMPPDTKKMLGTK